MEQPDDPLAKDLRGFGPVGILAILAILAASVVGMPFGAVLALAWAQRSGTPFRDIGYVRPASWALSLTIGLAFGAIFKLVMKTIVMPLLGAPPVNQAYHYLAGNRAALPFAVFTMIVVAGFGEETVFRGYLFERLGMLLGRGPWGRTSTVLMTSVLFALGHLADQGVAGAEQATITGLVFGTIFAFTGRIFVPMCAHAAFDLVALAIIYWDVESEVAHLVFK